MKLIQSQYHGTRKLYFDEWRNNLKLYQKLEITNVVRKHEEENAFLIKD